MGQSDQKLEWIFEPCSPEGALRPTGQEWPHAVRGRKPEGRYVIGYGDTPPQAQSEAEQRAREYDAYEVIGERGEIIAPVIGTTESGIK